MSLINRDCGFSIDDNYEDESWDWSMPFGCTFCESSEHTPVEPLVPIEPSPEEPICPPERKSPWDLGEAPDYGEYCDGQGMDCVCNPMAIVTGVPCYTTIFVDSLPQEGISGIMYVTPVGDYYGVYMWNGASWDTMTPVALLQVKTVDPSTSEQDVTPDEGYDGLADVHVNAMPSGNLKIPSGTYRENLLIGYLDIEYGVDTAGYLPVLSLPYPIRLMDVLPTENPKTVTPTTSEQIAVMQNKWTKGQIKVGPIPPEYIVPTGTKQITSNGSAQDVAAYEKVDVNVPASAVDTGTKNITSNGNGQDVVGYAAVNVNVPNSYAAGDEGKVVHNGALEAQTSDTVTVNGTVDTTLINSLLVNVAASGKAVQIDNTNHRISSTAYVDTGAKITVAKAGTYTVYYSAFRNTTSGTSGTQIYKNGVAQGTVNTTWENSYCQTPHVTMALAVDDVITVYARSRNTSYYTCVSNLTIIEQ